MGRKNIKAMNWETQVEVQKKQLTPYPINPLREAIKFLIGSVIKLSLNMVVICTIARLNIKNVINMVGVEERRILLCSALRSGKYSKHPSWFKGIIDGSQMHCVIGVAHDLLVQEQPNVYGWDKNDPSKQREKYYYYDAIYQEVSTLFGVEASKLADLNDLGMNFNALAEVIERGVYEI